MSLLDLLIAEHFAPSELGHQIGGRDYKHSAPPELSS
jgi:hypothetical protein